MEYEQPEWIDQLVLSLQGRARDARAHNRKLDPKKHYGIIGNNNSEATAYENAARMIEDAWRSEAEVVATLYDQLRTEVEALLVINRQATGVRNPSTGEVLPVVYTTEIPIVHSDIRILLARFPHKFPRLEEEEPDL